MVRIAGILVVAALSVAAQGFRFGVKGGVPLTQYFETGRASTLHGGYDYSAATRRYTFGVAGEWWLSGHFGLGVDLLYKRMGYVSIVETFGGGQGTRLASDIKGNAWEIPIFAKRRFSEGRLKPFVAGGGVLRIIGPVREKGSEVRYDLIAGTEETVTIDRDNPPDLRKRVYPGLVIGAGFEGAAGRVSLAPELRLTHWTANISGSGPAYTYGPVRFPSNQVEVLLSVLF